MSNLINDAARANRVNPSLTAESKLKPEWATTAMQQDAPLASAALAVQSLFDETGEVTSGISVIGTGRVVTETTYTNGEHIFVDLSENGSCCASVCPTGTTSGSQFPSIGSTGCSRDLTPLYTAALAMLVRKDSTALADLQKIAGVVAQGAFDDAFKASVEDFAAKVVDALENGTVLLSMRGGNINILTATRMKSVVGNGALLYGSAPTLFPQGAQPKGVLSSIETAKKQYSAYSANRNWTEEEIKLIPVRPDDEVVMPEVLTFASLILATKDSARPFQNFFWRGITGYGKSTGIEQLACILNVPLMRVTCDPDKEVRDYLVQIEPIIEAAPDAIPKIDEQELFYNPVAAAARLLGKPEEECEDYDTTQRVLDLYGEILASKTKSQKAEYRETRGEYLRALENGYIVEVQEPSRIKKQGVLVGLNEFDRPNARIPLLNERWTRRHPNALVVFTDNVGYSTCRELDPSVIRRFHAVVDSNEMSEDYVWQRCQANAGITDRELFKAMYDVWEYIRDYAQSQGFTGPCSIVELENCLLVLKSKGIETKRVLRQKEKEVKAAVRMCIINKVTSDADSQDSMESACATAVK